jgi:ubiquitin C-terminal hydrolase
MIGLANLGNTCYMNSVLQMLYTLKVINCHEHDNPLMKSLIILFDAMETSKINLSPMSLKKNIDKYIPKFKDKIEHDAHEFLIEIVDFLHKNFTNKTLIDLDKVNQFSSKMYQDYIKSTYNSFKFETDISKNMYFGLTKKLICQDCEFISYKFEDFMSLDIYPQNDNDTLNNCLNRYFETDYIYIECENCGSKDRNVEHSVQCSVNKLPKFLFIMLKRFTFSKGKPSKNNNRVEIQENLDLSHYYSTLNNSSTRYTLKSIICHQGKDLDTGHYVTLSKNNNQWVLFNDTKVNYDIKISQLDRSLPYILAYRLNE